MAACYNFSSFNDGSSSLPFLQLFRALNGSQEYAVPKLLRFRISSVEHIPPYISPVGAPSRAVARSAGRTPRAGVSFNHLFLQLLDVQSHIASERAFTAITIEASADSIEKTSHYISPLSSQRRASCFAFCALAWPNRRVDCGCW